MQGLVRQIRISGSGTSTKENRKDAMATLMETATKMMKNGATPDVITFIETTITEVNQNVLSVIVDEHHRDQALIDALLARFDAAVAAMEVACAAIQEKHNDRMAVSISHKQCRSEEALDCGRSRRCEEQLEHLWSIVRFEEEEMRRIHWAIHGEWCLGAAPEHPSLADPFHWTITEYKEGAETSESVHNYPAIDLEDDVIEFRRFSVDHFGQYLVQKPKVEEAWLNYNLKLQECRDLEVILDDKVDVCDGLQIDLNDKACEHSSSHRQLSSNFGHEYHMTMLAYDETVTAIRQLEFDRKREWETLHITTCLLETVYTHVIHSIDSGEPCPNTESHPEQTETEINYCHVVEENLTTNLTIDYGTPPDPILCPIDDPGPCTAQYIWDEHGSFPQDIQDSFTAALAADEGLENYFTTLSQHGWAGCAAPKACIPCDMLDLVVDPNYVQNDVCKEHQAYLRPGQMDFDTFRCHSSDQCILSSGRCNGESNCDDGSDEVGCHTAWGVPAVLQSEECQNPFVSDVQFRCADNSCTHIEGRCNGVNNCADGSDEQGCSSGITGLTIEATTGFAASIEVPSVSSHVFYDREYTFDTLGSFTGHSYIKMTNDDKHIRHSHVQMKLRLPHPVTVYIVRMNENDLPWLHSDGWALSALEGVSYHGVRTTRHTEWSQVLEEDFFTAGQVWEKTFPAGTVELRGNSGGDGSYLMFVANPSSPPTPPARTLWSQHLGDGMKCNNNVNMQYVSSQEACQNLAEANGHPFYSFRHNSESSGHKCMSSATCDSPLTGTGNEWNIYDVDAVVGPSNWIRTTSNSWCGQSNTNMYEASSSERSGWALDTNGNGGWRWCGITAEECQQECESLGACAGIYHTPNQCCFPTQSICEGNTRPGGSGGQAYEIAPP